MAGVVASSSSAAAAEVQEQKKKKRLVRMLSQERIEEILSWVIPTSPSPKNATRRSMPSWAGPKSAPSSAIANLNYLHAKRRELQQLVRTQLTVVCYVELEDVEPDEEYDEEEEEFEGIEEYEDEEEEGIEGYDEEEGDDQDDQ